MTSWVPACGSETGALCTFVCVLGAIALQTKLNQGDRLVQCLAWEWASGMQPQPESQNHNVNCNCNCNATQEEGGFVARRLGFISAASNSKARPLPERGPDAAILLFLLYFPLLSFALSAWIPRGGHRGKERPEGVGSVRIARRGSCLLPFWTRGLQLPLFLPLPTHSPPSLRQSDVFRFWVCAQRLDPVTEVTALLSLLRR